MSFRGLKFLAVIIILILFLGNVAGPFKVRSTKRPADLYHGKIRHLESSHDQDRDGVDDQTDILHSALAYISKRPVYKSNYYVTGYPTDGKGVCTDVVAFALLGAGYDLMQLVNDDIMIHPLWYDIDIPDINIDFRRVKNLRVYLENHAIKLTNDLLDIEEWQGGDIVVFTDHIGIISNRRNAKGIPYVIHHNSSFQKSYEEDILESRSDLTGHYRISE